MDTEKLVSVDNSLVNKKFTKGFRPSHLSLFTGIGGLDLAAEWAGFISVGQCEWADFQTRVLKKHWPDVPRWKDIRTLTKESFYEKTGRKTVDVVSGGFPCQPFSVAGKRRGKEDDRYLWPEMLRVVSELQPAWVVGENVAGIISLALDTVLSDLESIGYSCQALVIPACAVGAPHRRDRVCIVGWKRASGNLLYPNSQDCKCADVRKSKSEIQGQPWAGGLCETVSNEKSAKKQREWQEIGCGGPWPAEPNVGRVANGVPDRVDRLKCLGNAVVPRQFYPVFKAIFDIQFGWRDCSC